MLRQDIKYYEEVIEAEYAVEGYSLINYERSYTLSRALVNGKWIVYSGSKLESGQKKMKEFEICDDFYHESIKSWVNKEKYPRILDNINLDEEDQLKVISKKISRSILIPEVKECHEEKVVNYVKYNDLKFSYTGDPKDIPSIVQYLRATQSQLASRSRQILTESGRLTFILDSEIVASIFHHVLHNFLNGNSPKFKLNDKILGEITVYDNPLNSFSSSFSAFDDEGVKTKKKEIIGDGIVINYLGTLTSKYGEAGNARGILPKPDYFSVEVKQGDWSLNELIDESRGAYIAMGVKKSELVHNSIRITPRIVVKISQGQIFFREIAIPLQELVTIDAVTKENRGVLIDEEHGGVTPYVRMKVRAILY
ncbi:peptidase U62 [Saccharolobus solfataricus]|uniref:Peptidase U62 n=2 Tax=Saccharolobus solfataricus TaxID=2287 RepID=A0A0E3MCS1_SACSO|nr:metallopeptidase TldD-related protein [Saccharolobus solfataricus]AKA73775.1 peptidase U62 [Saccharolobus solfataricus]AKA76472.1 peptidase U62 [Saccharolobus solfataricus]AKA79165.1 peptidase U62 [Saccharolobus solfataricus]AZF68249.1 peptidase U62 [Saccharolobus solfataricus]AZF70869.1 peptidase U62 [Saccharolobus solfataricus]